MSKVKPTTKEQLIYFLIRNISLGTYDNRFLTNLEHMYVMKQLPVTSNQADLLDKITIRYTKQLRRKEIDANEMVNLSWTIDPVESTSEYTDAFITIKDDLVELRAPYKKDFIADIRKKELDIIWYKESKHWTAPLCESVLKHFIKCVEKHYHMIHYCNKTKEIINNLADYETAKYWDPTLVKVNDNFYIAGITSPLNDAIIDIELNSDPASLARLACYGINISDEVMHDAIENLGDTSEAYKLVDFAISLGPIVDCSQPELLVKYLQKIKCDFVLIVESFGVMSKDLPSLIKHLTESKFPYEYIDRQKSSNSINLEKYNFPITINSGLWATPSQSKIRHLTSKTVYLGNNKPIDIK